MAKYVMPRKTGTWDLKLTGRPECLTEGCLRPSVGRGLCTRHWQHAKYHGYLDQFPLTHADRQSDFCKRGHPKTSENIRNRGDGSQGGCRLCFRETWNARRKRLKDAVHSAYGNKCVCCGEPDASFLCIDHVNGDGNVQRKAKKADGQGVAFYKYIIDAGFPSDLQLLCFNCNMAKAISGVNKCPGHGFYPSRGGSLRNLVDRHDVGRKASA